MSREEPVRRALDTASRRVPMPDGLAGRLRAIGRPAEESPVPAAPKAPLPPELRRRLQEIARPSGSQGDSEDGAMRPKRQRALSAARRNPPATPAPATPEESRRPLPRWLASPRWAVAASGVLALLLGGLAGGPDTMGRYVTAASGSAGSVARTVGSYGGETLREIEQRVEATWQETRGKLPLESWNVKVDQIPLAGELLGERSEPDERRPE